MKLGSLQLASRWWLAPLAGYTNWAFRKAVREIGGVGLATTDLVNARALLSASRKTLELLQTCPEDKPLSVQIYGSEPGFMAEAARWLENYGAAVIDINMGCPVHKVVKTGGGSALMCSSPSATIDLVRSVVEAVRLPVTVKMRLGWDANNLSAPFFAREFEQAGVAAVIVHGRTREQGFGGAVDLDGIRAVVEAVERIPIIGNGDVRSLADADRMLLRTGCAGIAIGRGALLNPWIFLQLCLRENPEETPAGGSYEDRVRFLVRHFELLLEYRGVRNACLTFRKVASWYCKVLRTGKEVQQRLVMLDDPATLRNIAAELLAKGPPHHWQPHAEIAVPSGPNERW